jgi:hypothetical protein
MLKHSLLATDKVKRTGYIESSQDVVSKKVKLRVEICPTTLATRRRSAKKIGRFMSIILFIAINMAWWLLFSRLRLFIPQLS